MHKLTVGSLFAGIGGIELGLEWTGGFKTVWQVENDSYAQAVLKKHWPDVGRWDDVRTFPPPPAEDWRCDVITFGFPCTDISVAGKQAGLDGKYSGLFFEAVRVVGLIMPRWLVVENVSALLSLGMGTVVKEVAALGYCVAWRCISAASFGAPHKRERILLLADRDGDCHTYAGASDPVGIQSESFQWWRGRLDELGASDGIERRDSYADIMRAVDGIPAWLDRIRCCGNAVVPQVAQWIGERILEAERGDD